MISQELKNAYTYQRKSVLGYGFRANLGQAQSALARARADVANGTERHNFNYISRLHYFNGRMSWVERPADIGLRFVGYADKIVSLRHTGWYTDPEGERETLRGVVYQLPGRNGKPLFVAGHDNTDNGAADSGGPALIDFGTLYEGEGTELVKPRDGWSAYWAYETNPADHDGAKEAARGADSFAEKRAEEEREYQTAWQAGSMYAMEGERIKEVRKGMLALMKERREIMYSTDTGKPPHAICNALRGAIGDMLDTIREARAKRAQLKSGDFDGLEFYEHDSSLQSAFADGANLTAAINGGACAGTL